MTQTNVPVRLTILGELASKANSRRLVMIGRRPRFILSEKAMAWRDQAVPQIPILDPLLDGPLSISVAAWYASERPDLDASLLYDVLQGRIYRNDRQLREQYLWHGIDKENPRAAVVIRPRYQ